jgi:hypothetical protein
VLASPRLETSSVRLVLTTGREQPARVGMSPEEYIDETGRRLASPGLITRQRTSLPPAPLVLASVSASAQGATARLFRGHRSHSEAVYVTPLMLCRSKESSSENVSGRAAICPVLD